MLKTARTDQRFGIVELRVADRRGGDFNVMVFGEIDNEALFPAGSDFDHLVTVLDVFFAPRSSLYFLLSLAERDLWA